MKHIIIITTGGTIAMQESKEKGILPIDNASDYTLYASRNSDCDGIPLF